MFKRIMTEKPEMMSKIIPVWGEITQPNLGMSNEHLRRVIETSQIVFHLAASLKLEATLKPNIETNLTATKYVLDVAKQMKNLIQMVHTSTAFCNIEDDIVYERVYDHPHDPEDIIRTTQWMSEDALALAQKKILDNHPNTYTYTKLLAENLVKKYYQKENLPVSIFRPSIVVPAYQEPLPGWVDSLNGPPGVIMAVGGGALRCMLLNIDAEMQSIPVDICINALITSTKYVATMNR
jgi:alcohol-forming fatty acyl-CoA reductase